MTFLTKRTAKLLCARAGIANKEIPLEAQRILDLHNDPNVSQQEKDRAMQALDDKIRDLEERTSRRIRGQYAS